MEYESNHFCNEKNRGASLSAAKRPSQAGKDVAALLKRIRIHPEAIRILGNSSVAVVSLERLNFQKMFLSSCLQPMVSLVRLPCQTQAGMHNGTADLDHPQQANGLSQKETNTREERRRAASLQSTPAESSEPNQIDSELTSWTEPYCPESASFEEPEQDSGFDCDSNPDQTYILCDSESDEGDPDGRQDSETFYLDPDPEQTLVIELDPELDVDQDRPMELEGESEAMCEMDTVQMDENNDHRSDLCRSEMEVQVQVQQPETGPGAEEMESEDFCAVCLNGGDLLCCDRCPKVYHMDCHLPPITGLPLGDWVCTLCRTDQDSYDCENMSSCGGVKAPYTLSNQDQTRCEKLTLLLYCHTLSAPFHEAVSPLARNYYQIIKRPINLSVIRRKLDKSNTLHYFTAEQFVDDVLLMFRNCATFNYPDSEVAQAGRNLEMFFLSKLGEFFPEHTFPSASQDTTDRARLRWLSRKRKENYRKKKKYVFRGKKYYL